eukprot:s1060_g2.t1
MPHLLFETHPASNPLQGMPSVPIDFLQPESDESATSRLPRTVGSGAIAPTTSTISRNIQNDTQPPILWYHDVSRHIRRCDEPKLTNAKSPAILTGAARLLSEGSVLAKSLNEGYKNA